MLKRTLIAAGVITVAALILLTAPIDAAGPSLDIPDVHYGEAVTLEVGKASNLALIVRCSGYNGTGVELEEFTPVNGRVVLELDSPPMPAGGAQCVGELGRWKGNGQFTSSSTSVFELLV